MQHKISINGKHNRNMCCGEEVDDLNLTVCRMQNAKSQYHYVKIESVVSTFDLEIMGSLNIVYIQYTMW